MRATAALATAPGADFTIDTVEVDDPRPDEILVRVAGVGICHTDLVTRDSLVLVRPPAILGHEGAGVVERVGRDVKKVRPGDHVVMTFNSCGHCAQCGHGEPAYCRSFGPLNMSGRRPDGSTGLHWRGQEVSSNFFGQSSFATLALAYERNVVAIPGDVPLAIMGPLGCGVQTGAGAIMNSLACRPGSSLVVVGAGAVGLSAVLGAVVQGCGIVIAIDPLATRRGLALELGATHAVDPRSCNVVDEVRAAAPTGIDYVFDTSGLSSALLPLIDCLASHASVGFVGIPPDRTDVLPIPLGRIVGGGWSFQGILEGDSIPDEFIPRMVDLYRAGRFPFDRLVKTYALSEINQAISDQHAGLCAKAVLLMGSEAAALAAGG